MKKLKEKIRLWLFEELVRIIFKVSKTFRLIRFEKVVIGGKTDYVLTIRTDKPFKSLTPHVEEYLKTSAKVNQEKLYWENEGFFHESIRKRMGEFKPTVVPTPTNNMSFNVSYNEKGERIITKLPTSKQGFEEIPVSNQSELDKAISKAQGVSTNHPIGLILNEITEQVKTANKVLEVKDSVNRNFK